MRVVAISSYFLPLILFSLSMMGIVLNRSNIILILICIEMMLLSITINLMLHSFMFNSLSSQLSSVFIITVTAVESAIGLSIMITFYKLKGSISVRLLNLLKG